MDSFYDDYKEALLSIVDSNIPIVYNSKRWARHTKSHCTFMSMLMWMQKSKSFALTITKINNFSIFAFVLIFANFYDIFEGGVYD